MAPNLVLTVVVHPSLMTGFPSLNNDNTYTLPFERKHIISFFKVLISANKPKEICYSFAVPPVSSSKNRFLDDEIPLNFACVLSFAEAAAHKGIPIHLYPKGCNPDYSAIEYGRGRTLHLTDFKDFFAPKLDKGIAENLRQKLSEMGNFRDVSYPELSKFKKNDDRLSFIGQLSVSPISSESVVNLLANGTNMILTTESNENFLIQMTPQYTTEWDEFDITWHATQDDSHYSCGKLNIPVVVDSSKMYYSRKSTNLMDTLKTEFSEWIKRNASGASANPFHPTSERFSEVDDSKMETKREASFRQFLLGESITERKEEKASSVASPEREQTAQDDKKEQNSDGQVSFTAKQLTDFLKEFKMQMREELVGVVEETVKKYSAKDGAEGLSFPEKQPEVLSVINVDECVKSEADNSDLPKLLCTLSEIEEQLSLIENAAGGSDVASTKPNKYAHHYGGHAGHRRGRDFNSLTRRATLGILKKRMKGSVVELEPDLFAISKSGFKLKMARNVTQSFRFVLFKYGKYRNSKFEVDFMPTIVPGGGLDCCVKPTTKNLDKSQIDDKGLYSFYDVRFKSKDRTGKFRCFLKILRNGKVCAHPLCINVRVKRFCSNSDQVDSAEEAVPNYSSSERRSRFSENRFAVFEPMSVVNAEVDEGIEFHEYLSSLSSDSDDVDANRENDNDEGIDPGLKMPCSSLEKLKITEERSPRSNFDDDSDSSVSLLLDENEVREVVDKEFETLKIPPCFIPSADIDREHVSVRVKRKLSAARRKKVNEAAVHTGESSPKMREWWTLDGNQSAGSSCSKKSETKSSSDVPKASPFSSPKDYRPFRQEPFNSYLFPRYKKDAREVKDDVAAAGPSSAKTEAASGCAYKPLYPNLEELHETKPKKAAKIPTATKETQSPVAILPEKVFEMTSNVFKSVMNSMKQPSSELKENIQKNVDETLWSIFGGGVPFGHPYAAPAPPSPASPPPSAPTAAAASSPPPPPADADSPGSAPSPSASASENAPLNQHSTTTTSYAWSTPSPTAQTSIPTPVPEVASVSAAAAAATAAAAAATSAAAAAAAAAAPVMTTPTMGLPMTPPYFAQSPPFCMPASPSASVFGGQEAASSSPRQSTSVGTNTPGPAGGMSTASMLLDPTPVLVETVTSPPLVAARKVIHRNPNYPMPSDPEMLMTAPPVETNSRPSSSRGRSFDGDRVDRQPKRGLIAGNEYNRLEPEVREKIFLLNEMGFNNDSYNLFLIRKYPQDLNKVVESLVNFNDV